MRKSFTLIIALTMVFATAQYTLGQDWGITFSGGIASSRMDDMKYLQEYILSTYPVEGKITSAFPPFTCASVNLFKQLYDHIRVGGGYSFSATGGKSSYADYTGSIYTEMAASSHRLGAYLSYLVLGGDRLELSLKGRVDANYTSLSIESYYTIYNISSSLTNQYRSLSPSLNIGTELMYKLKKVSLGMDAGYLIDLQGKLSDKGDGDMLLDPNDTDRVLSSDWTGWYVQLKAHVWLNF